MEALSELVDLEPRTIWNMENKLSWSRAKTFDKLSQALEIDVTELFCDDILKTSKIERLKTLLEYQRNILDEILRLIG